MNVHQELGAVGVLRVRTGTPTAGLHAGLEAGHQYLALHNKGDSSLPGLNTLLYVDESQTTETF